MKSKIETLKHALRSKLLVTIIAFVFAMCIFTNCKDKKEKVTPTQFVIENLTIYDFDSVYTYSYSEDDSTLVINYTNHGKIVSGTKTQPVLTDDQIIFVQLYFNQRKYQVIKGFTIEENTENTIIVDKDMITYLIGDKRKSPFSIQNIQ